VSCIAETTSAIQQAANFEFFSPNKSSAWLVGSLQNITWGVKGSADKPPTNVTITYQNMAGSILGTVGTVPNTNTYFWTVSNQSYADTYVLRICPGNACDGAFVAGSILAASSQPFSIYRHESLNSTGILNNDAARSPSNVLSLAVAACLGVLGLWIF
jgi:hypothetical protein